MQVWREATEEIIKDNLIVWFVKKIIKISWTTYGKPIAHRFNNRLVWVVQKK